MNLYLLAATGTKRCYVTIKHSIIIDYVNLMAVRTTVMNIGILVIKIP